jgi:tetratricopeptide (TPR) repeat protein
MPVPGQLLPVPANFTDRSGELAALSGLIAGEGPPEPLTLAVVVGVGGVGKTSLVLRWLHEVRGRFPAGQLYADLGGQVPDEAVAPGEVLSRFLRALGVAGERVPAGLEDQAGLYRSLTDGQRLIVMLDNAASAAQVRALLPGPGPSLVAVTTRWRLAGLAIDGARFTELGPLAEPDAVELLDRVAGRGRARSEPAAARAVVRLCGRLPLAVCVSGARLAPHPSWRVERVAGELAGERGRLAALSLSGDVSVRAAFDVSYRALPAGAARMYRLLSLIPGPGFGAGLAAVATGLGPEAAAGLLEVLTGACLLEETGEGRFRFHDLVRLHAREQAAAEPAAERDAVTARAVGWYLGKAVAADLVVIPGRWRLGDRYDQARQSAPAYDSPAGALAWLEAELPGLLAALQAAQDQGLHEEAWQLCEALWGLFINRKHFAYWASSHRIGIASARACGNPRAEARMRDQLGYGYLNQRRYQDAAAELRQALALDRQDGHRIGEATELEHLGQVDLGLGRPGQAIERFAEARVIHRQIGVPRGVALMTCRIGEAHRDAGRYQEAISDLGEARRLLARLPDPFNEARALTGLGQALISAGQPGEATGPLTEALAAMTRLGSRYEQARIHTALAEAAVLLGDSGGARSHLEEALEIYAGIGAPEAAEIRQRQAALGPAVPGAQATASDTDTIPP